MEYNSGMPKSNSERRTQSERTASSRKKILQEATRLFSENGFRGTRLADIARAVEMTEPGVLHHFQSKENLLLSVLEERDRVDTENYFRVLDDSNFNFLRAMKSLVEHNERIPSLVQLFTVLVAESIPADQPGHAFFINRYQSIRKIAIDFLEKAKQRGEIREDVSCEDLAIMLIAMMDGLQIQWLLEPEQVDMSKEFSLYLDLLSASCRTLSGK